ncbi:MAG: hypothetical protein ACJATI_000384 [Halioglobus sp.]|jgi:hypothetical protein
MKKSLLKIFSLFFLFLFSFYSLFIRILFAFVSSSSSSGCDESEATADAERIFELAKEYIADIQNEEKCKNYVNAVEQFVADYRDC